MARPKKSKVEPETAAETPAELKSGYVADFISGLPVKDTPEERDAVQVFARRLVEDYGYPKDLIQTRPQYRVRIRPSDEEKSYPVDTAVFRTSKKLEDELFMVVECKKKTRKDGVAQLKLYLDMSAAEVGVWFNGDEHQYLRKILHKNGSRTYEPLPSIPRHGQRIEDIGLYKRKDLKKPSNLKAVFRDLRNHLAGMTTGITRDEALAQEIINILFCKILDEQRTDDDGMVEFRAGVGESPELVQKRLMKLFDEVKRATFNDVFAENDAITLDAESVRYVVGELQNYRIMEADRDAIGDAFEVFIGPALRGSEGQFFTPRNVVKLIVDMLDPQPWERVIDPACGSGGFLVSALLHVWKKYEEGRKQTSYSMTNARNMASQCFDGIDKDAFLAKVCKAYMALIGDGRGGVFCENSLNPPETWAAMMRERIKLDKYDVVLTNPPFGVHIPIKGQSMLAQYQLGHKWVEGPPFGLTSLVKEEETPQILFIERCVQLLKPGGRMGIVLPEGIFGNRGMGYVLDYLRGAGKIVAIIDCTRRLFQPHTDTKTNVVIFRKSGGKTEMADKAFLAVAKTCGHDKRGKMVFRPDGTADDEIAEVAAVYHGKKKPKVSRLGFRKRLADMEPYYLVPRYYSPEVTDALSSFAGQTQARLVAVGDLIAEGALKIGKGHEIGSTAYGTGEIPFIRTSDIANLEITHDPTFGVSEDIYEEYAAKQQLRPLDILFVNDGRYRIGQVCMLTEFDIRIVIQSHFRVIRSLDHKTLDPFLLLYLFRHPVVRLQVEAKTFIQSTIATLGPRLKELILPVPQDLGKLRETVSKLRHGILERARLRAELRELEADGIN